MHILSPLLKTQAGIKFTFIMMDCNSKQALADRSESTTALHVASLFLDDWVVPYEFPAQLLTGNRPQLVASFQDALQISWSQDSYYEGIPAGKNGQAERYKKKNISCSLH